MSGRLTAAAGSLVVCASAIAQPDIDPTQGCVRNPARVGACFEVDGRLVAYNGTPSVRIQPHGSRRILGVVPSEQELMPDTLKQSIGTDTSATARMTVCPMSPPRRGHMQLVCIESARDIRVVPRR